MSSTERLSKLFKSLFFLFFIFSSCTKNQDKLVAIQVGDSIWSLQDIQDYFQSRLNSENVKSQDLKKLKKKFLNEIFLILLIENWAKKNQRQGKAVTLSKEDKKAFLKHNTKLKALKDHKKYVSLHNLLLEHLYEKIPDPPLKRQKNFYNKNKPLFIEPAFCYLKQIFVEKERLAQSLQKRLNQGESFDDLSNLYSLNSHPGWVKQGELEVFDEACFKHKKPLTPVLKSPYGYHIFLREGQKPPKKKSFKQAQSQIIKTLKISDIKKHFQIWLKEEAIKTPVWTSEKLLDRLRIQHKPDK